MFYFEGEPSLNLPEPRWEAPELLIPGRKPTGPVVIDWSHPLARGGNVYGIRACYLFDSHIVRNLISGETFTANATPGVTQHGKGYSFNGSSEFIDVTRHFSADVPHTVLVGISGVGAQRGDVFTCGNSSDVQPLVRLSVNDSAGTEDNVQFQIRPDTTGDFKATTGDVNITGDGRLRVIGGAHDRYALSSSGNVYVYVDGVETVGDVATSTNSSTLNTCSVGSLLRTSRAIYYSGNVHFLYVWGRKLGATEVAEISRNPYQFLIPA